MFDYPGEKLKTLAVVVFALDIILLIVYAVILADSSRDFNVLSFLLILVAGGIVSYVSCLGIYAFGELVESSAETNSQMQDILRKLGNSEKKSSQVLNNRETMYRAAVRTDEVAASVSNASSSVSETSTKGVQEAATTDTKAEQTSQPGVYMGNRVSCVHCGYLNLKSRHMCEKCGQKIRE